MDELRHKQEEVNRKEEQLREWEQQMKSNSLLRNPSADLSSRQGKVNTL